MSKAAHSIAPYPFDRHLHEPQNLAEMLADAVTAAPDREALVCCDDRLTYSDFAQRIASLISVIRTYASKGQMVAVIAPNSAECVVAMLATLCSGCRVVPVNPFYPKDEIGRLFTEAPALILAVASSRETANALSVSAGNVPIFAVDQERPLPGHQNALETLRNMAAEISPDDPTLLIFTGGTTGRSKAVEHSHRALICSIRQHATVWNLRYDEERFLNVAPLFHIWAFGFAMLAPIYLRGTLVLIERYDPEQVLNAIGTQEVTVFAGGPAPIYYGLLHSPALPHTDFSTLQLALTGGAACPQVLKEAWTKAAECPLLEGWGMSEGAPLSLNWRREIAPELSVGRPVPGGEAQVVDLEDDTRVLSANEIGEIRVRGPQLMSGYRMESGEPDLSMRNDWLYTGDIGRIDENGFVFLVDRKKEIIISGGYNVYPRDVEDILRRNPMIKDVAVVGQKDDYLGETPVAFIVSDHPFEDLGLESFCREHMVKYKRPTRFIPIYELPRTGPSKINKIALREMLNS